MSSIGKGDDVESGAEIIMQEAMLGNSSRIRTGIQSQSWTATNAWHQQSSQRMQQTSITHPHTEGKSKEKRPLSRVQEHDLKGKTGGEKGDSFL